MEDVFIWADSLLSGFFYIYSIQQRQTAFNSEMLSEYQIHQDLQPNLTLFHNKELITLHDTSFLINPDYMSFTCGTRVAISFIIHNDQLVMTPTG